jgi:hypothetical protein
VFTDLSKNMDLLHLAFRRIIFAVFLIQLLSPAWADIYTVSRNGNAIMPLISTEVSMEAETVFIEESKDGYNVTATFVMKNHSSNPVTALVGFPVTGPSSSYSNHRDVNQEFKVGIKNGTDASTSFEPVLCKLIKDGKPAQETEDQRAGYEENVVWEVNWAPAETKTISVSYQMGEPGFLPGSTCFAQVTQILYVVRTGALWRGPIGKADITIRFSHKNDSSDHFIKPELVAYPEVGRWASTSEWTWHFENWIPTDDIWVRWPKWEGLNSDEVWAYRFALPDPYEGSQKSYTTALLYSLVDRELAMAKKYFPQEYAAYDRTPLRKAIAEWLYRELFARHGEAFKKGPDAILWATAFGLGYGHYDNWYKGNKRVRFSDLSELEQQNARFLLKVFAPNFPEKENPTRAYSI